jgi:hypothetical protein
MNDETSEFVRLLGKSRKEAAIVQTAYAICKSVDWTAKTMVATGQTDSLDYFDVKLGNGFEYKKPKVGSLCLIGVIENKPASTFLIDASEVEGYYVKANTSEVEVENEGITIKRGNQDLKSVLNDMIDEINKIKVIYGNSIDVVAMTVIKDRLNSILK